MTETNAGSVMDGTQALGSQLSKDVNAGFAFFLDVVVNIFVLAGLLLGVFNFPSEVVFGKIVPGSIVGILVGNLFMIHLARKTAIETGNPNLTSIPLGLDLPTVFGMIFFVLGPVYVINVDALGAEGAADLAWKVGMASALWMAVFKYAISYFGKIIQTSLPQMALIGAMVCIAAVWLGAEAILGIFSLPEVGVLSLIIMIYALTANHKLPFAMPGAILAIVLTTGLYYVLAFAGFGTGYVVPAVPEMHAALPMPSLGAFEVLGLSLNYLGIVLPFALLIAASGINIVAGARITGDEYQADKVVRRDALATAISALFGGVVQTTPYFGHITYKRMGARTHYALGAAALITIGGFAGVISLASQLIPGAVLKPILTIVACDIIRLAVVGADVRHAPALIFSIVPGILNYAHNKVSDLYGRMEGALNAAEMKLSSMLGVDWMAGYALLGALSRGYILTSLMWATLVIWIIDKKRVQAAYAAFTCGIFTLFGVIHSVMASSEMYLPWNLTDMGGVEDLPFRIAGGYFAAGVLLLVLHAMDSDKEPVTSST